MQIKSAILSSKLHFYILGLPQILICGKSGGNGRTYDLAEWFSLLRSICRNNRALVAKNANAHVPYIPRTRIGAASAAAIRRREGACFRDPVALGEVGY